MVHFSGGSKHVVATTADGAAYSWGMSQWLEPRQLGFEDNAEVTTVSCGENFSMLCTQGGDLYSWSKGFLQSSVLGTAGRTE